MSQFRIVVRRMWRVARLTMSHGISSSDLNELLMLLFNFIQIVRKIELLIIENVGKCLCFTIKNNN